MSWKDIKPLMRWPEKPELPFTEAAKLDPIEKLELLKGYIAEVIDQRVYAEEWNLVLIRQPFSEWLESYLRFRSVGRGWAYERSRPYFLYGGRRKLGHFGDFL